MKLYGSLPFYKSFPLNLNLIKSVHILSHYFSVIHFTSNFPYSNMLSVLVSPHQFPEEKVLQISYTSHVCYLSNLPQPRQFDYH